MMRKKSFASDNNSGICTEVLTKLNEINKDDEISYGSDSYTKRAEELFKEYFGANATPYFVFTGTAANVLGINSFTNSYNSIICSSTAHINMDECGAPEKFNGTKLISVKEINGKIAPDNIEPYLDSFGFEHHSQPKVISISQPTELGTVYSIDEIIELSQFAKKHTMYLHMDGARLANAAVFLQKSFKEITTDAGVDVLSFGGTKNGLMAAESVVFLNDNTAEHFKYIRKQGMQLASKMRYISAQFIAYFEDDLWYRNALNSNNMAQYLYDKIKDLPEIKITQAVETNSIFTEIPKSLIPTLQKEYFFYVWDKSSNLVRWMTSFDTTEEDIELFANKIKELLN